ncbi:AGAP007408-PA [Anopheles gambiae str. PEST]|uniref:AGAP007408-PA n=2 Tax=gambiae species complex TaxID=44542 RepID=Q5TWX1_ANOGA|nr:AGAP007408-PA [Anopheles gambiae str. PEST]
METKRLANWVAILLSFLAIGLISTHDTSELCHGKYYFGNTFKINWYKATHYCRSRGMFLVSINNHAQLNGVIKCIQKSGHMNLNNDLDMWTSGNDLGEEGQFFFSSTGERVTFNRWDKGEPNNAWHGMCVYENCVTLHFKLHSVNYTLGDRPCGKEKFFMCEAL